MGKADSGSVGARGSTGYLSLTSHISHIPESTASLLIGGGSSEHAQEACYRGVLPQKEGFLSTIFLIPKDGGQRPVINLMSLNAFVHMKHFKIEGIHVLKDLQRAGDQIAQVDLKDTYIMVPIREEDRAFLKFSFRSCTYQIKYLPFGLACIFTKSLRPVATLLRQLETQLIVYIDNTLILTESKELAQDHAIA